MSPRARLRVVVDGSNLATEGRTDPSLAQLDEAVRAFIEENPGADVIVVADATFEHRVAPGERARFKEAELAGEIVTPPAGAIGRGDAFILKIADRIKGVVLSNDSFQEFHGEYPWLFEEGRLIGGKPVPGVGWVFTPRLPVRGAKSPRTVKKLSVVLPGGAKPAIGATLTPVKRAAKATTAAKAPAKAAKKAAPAKAAKKAAPAKPKPEKAAKAPAKAAKKAAAAKPEKAAKAPAKAAKKAAAAARPPRRPSSATASRSTPRRSSPSSARPTASGPGSRARSPRSPPTAP